MSKVLIGTCAVVAVISLAIAPGASAGKKKYDVTQTIQLTAPNPPAGSRVASFTGVLVDPVCATATAQARCPAKIAKACNANRTIKTLAGSSQITSTTGADGSFSGQVTYDGDFGGQAQTITLRSQANRVNIRTKRLKINCRQSYDPPGGTQVTFSP
ncbi:MAG: hypothetical protein ACXWEA_04240 [Solirubrobacterales bacterium]